MKKLIAGSELLVRQCTPTDGPTKDLKLVLLFKFILYNFYQTDLSLFVTAITPFVEKSMHAENQIEEFASILT